MDRRKFLGLGGGAALASAIPSTTQGQANDVVVGGNDALAETAFGAMQHWRESVAESIASGIPVDNLSDRQKAMLRGDKEFYDAHFSFIPAENRQQLSEVTRGYVGDNVFIDVTNNVITAYRRREINIDRFGWERAGFAGRDGVTEDAAFKNASTRPQGEIIPAQRDASARFI